MKTPEHPAGPAFEKAAQALEAWRRQQIAALTDTQRRLYEEARRKAEEREKEKAKQLEARKQADVEERMRKKILEHPRLEYVLGGGRSRITEVLARRLTEEYFRPGQSPTFTQFEILVRDAAHAATREIEQEHARERQAVQLEEHRKSDEMLRRFESARLARPELRPEFIRAGVKDKAKTDFGKAASGGTTDTAKSEAIARAIAKVKAKDEEERARDDRSQGRERLTDTFNKVR